MVILVTGGNGHLGRCLVQTLQERGDTVRVLALPGEDTSWLEQRGTAVYRGDVCQPETLAAPMRGSEAVFHLAAMIGVWRPFADYHAVNVTGTENVCRAALVEGVGRFIHVSSWTVYGMGRGEPVTEDHPLKPLKDPHVLTKAEADQLVRRMIVEDGLPAVVVRPGTFFGPGDELHFGRIADRLRTGNWVISGSGGNALPLVYVTDVVQGLLLALDHRSAVGNVYNITNDSPLTQRDFVNAIAHDVDLRPPRFRIPYRPLYAVASVDERLVKLTRSQRQPVVTRLGVALFGTDNRHTIDKARRELGYEPQMPLRAGVRLAAASYRLQSQRAQAAAPAVELGVGTSG